MKPEQLQYQLSRAAGNGDVEKVRLLVAQGANLKHRDPWERTPLIEAVAEPGLNRLAVISTLVELGSVVDAQNRKGFTALMEAVIKADHEIVELLLNSGADPTIKNRSGHTALDLARPEGKSHLLLERALKERRKAEVDLAKRERTSKSEAHPNRRPQR